MNRGNLYLNTRAFNTKSTYGGKKKPDDNKDNNNNGNVFNSNISNIQESINNCKEIIIAMKNLTQKKG